MLLLSCLFPFILFAQGPKNALTFNGFNNYVSFSHDSRGITNQVTTEAWIKTTSLNNQHFVVKYDRDRESGFQLHTLNGKAGFSGRDGSGQYRLSGYSDVFVADGEWHHLAGVCTGTSWLIYVDGVLQGESVTNYTQTDLRSDEPLLVGTYFYLGQTWYYNGEVDEIRVWNRALTAEEIRKNMCKTIPDNSTNLVAYFKLDETSGSTVQDHSSYRLHGVFQDMDAASARVTSGAAIGDRSVYLYPSTWQNQKVEIAGGNGNKVWVDQIVASPFDQGIHLYYVGGRPNSTVGISNPQSVTEYYGVFPAIGNTNSYVIQYESPQQLCEVEIFSRKDNATSAWNLLNPAVANQTTSTQTDGARKEFVVQNKTELPIVGATSFCTGSSIELEVNTDLDPTWSTGHKGKKITITEAGKYWVTAPHGTCLATDTITVQELPVPAINLGSNIILCPGTSATIQAPAGFSSYLWSNGSQSSSITVNTAGTYSVEVTNASGCTSQSIIQVEEATVPTIILPDNQHYSVCYGENALINATTAGATYQWSDGSTFPTLTAAATGEYWVDIIVNGCAYRRTVQVTYEECPQIPNIITPNGDGLNDTFILIGLPPNNVRVEIYNRWGKLIYKSGNYQNNWGSPDIAAGSYYYYIKSSSSSKEFKGWLEVMK